MYVDGYLLTVKAKDIEAYRKIASGAGKVWIEHGALHYCESVSDDIDIDFGRSFAVAAAAQKGDLVVFSFVLYKSRAHRDRVNKKVMADPRLSPEQFSAKKMPFRMDMMSFGGFKPIVNLKAKVDG